MFGRRSRTSPAARRKTAYTSFGGAFMEMLRLGITEPANSLPIISKVVVHGDIVYTCGVTADPGGDIAQQTQQVLDRIDRLLRAGGTDKSRLLTAQVWLRDMSLFGPHNEVWNM